MTTWRRRAVSLVVWVLAGSLVGVIMVEAVAQYDEWAADLERQRSARVEMESR